VGIRNAAEKMRDADETCRGSLEEVYGIAKLTANNTVSVGASLEHVHVPGRAIPDPNSDEIIPTEEIEVGMGIHNEPGSHRVSASLPELIKIILAQMLDSKDEDRAYIKVSSSDKFVLFINNLGGVSTLEMSGICAEVSLQLKKDYNIEPLRTIQGTFLTSLNGMGFSVSILKLVDTGLGQGKSMLELLDAPAEAVGWAAPIRTETWEKKSDATMEKTSSKKEDAKPSNLKSKFQKDQDTSDHADG
jgi:triose/dihydroxyacetone kinase / FAD-AMP lyase (cyclizing)